MDSIGSLFKCDFNPFRHQFELVRVGRGCSDVDKVELCEIPSSGDCVGAIGAAEVYMNQDTCTLLTYNATSHIQVYYGGTRMGPGGNTNGSPCLGY